jgi:hypothetical protein
MSIQLLLVELLDGAAGESRVASWLDDAEPFVRASALRLMAVRTRTRPVPAQGMFRPAEPRRYGVGAPVQAFAVAPPSPMQAWPRVSGPTLCERLADSEAIVRRDALALVRAELDRVPSLAEIQYDRRRGLSSWEGTGDSRIVAVGTQPCPAGTVV